MKNKFYTAIVLILTTFILASCYSSRKGGCPNNPQANYKFKG